MRVFALHQTIEGACSKEYDTTWDPCDPIFPIRAHLDLDKSLLSIGRLGSNPMFFFPAKKWILYIIFRSMLIFVAKQAYFTESHMPLNFSRVYLCNAYQERRTFEMMTKESMGKKWAVSSSRASFFNWMNPLVHNWKFEVPFRFFSFFFFFSS